MGVKHLRSYICKERPSLMTKNVHQTRIRWADAPPRKPVKYLVFDNVALPFMLIEEGFDIDSASGGGLTQVRRDTASSKDQSVT
eukprot:3595-Heterococcus_DN1.PRE.2